MVESIAKTAWARSPFAAWESGQEPAQKPTRVANRAGQTGVQVSASTCASVVLISTWLSGAAALEGALGQALGASAPAQPGHTLRTPMGLLLRTGPVEYLLVGDAPSAPDASLAIEQLRSAIAPDVGSVTDLSHARCKISVAGDHSLRTLNKLFALDLRDAAFPVGEVRMTGTHHVPCTLHRLATDRFDLYVFTTYAQDQLQTVLDAALEFGYALSVG